MVCDETGQVVDGDILLGLFGLHALRAGKLGQKTLVATVHSNLGLDHAIRAAGGEVERVDVGDRNVARRMRAIGSNIGGESSGHIIFSDFATTGDGLLAAVKLVEIMCDWQAAFGASKAVVLFQKTRNLRVEKKVPFECPEALPKCIG